ncbi:MAG TPA: MFS transporter [bacterium]|nr:MFS transporter [bacterium]
MIPVAGAGPPTRLVRPVEVGWLGLYWFAISFHWGALLTVVIPAEVLRFVPEAQKGAYLGALFAAGAVMAMVISPISGALSDRSTLSMGRRRPFVIAGTLVSCLGLLAMRYATGYAWYVGAVVIVQTATNFAGGAFNGLIPDKIPPSQRGMTSGVMGFMMMIGTISAVLVAGDLVGRGQTPLVYGIDIGVLLVCTAMMASQIREERLPAAPPIRLPDFLRSFWIDPRRYPDFGWLFLTRGLVMLGFYTLISFLQFFVKDTLHLSVREAARTTSVLSAITIAAATLVALAAGVLSDRIGRKGIVSTAGFFLALTSLGLLMQPPLSALKVIAVLFGVGYGAYTSVDWALAIDVLPPTRSAAKDLGIWAIANTLPQVVAPILAGPVIDAFNRGGSNLGYSVAFALAIVYVTLGSVFVWKIRGAR